MESRLNHALINIQIAKPQDPGGAPDPPRARPVMLAKAEQMAGETVEETQLG